MVYTRRAPGKQSPNEDCVALIPYGEQSGVLLVADGLGGLPAGATASHIATSTLDKVLAQSSADTALRDAILDGFEKANQTILAQAGGSATTLIAVELQNYQIRSYHVGDSMILVVGQRGKVKSYTVSHSPTAYALEAGIINEKEAMQHNDRHIVFNVVGSTDMSITIGNSLKLAKYDTLLIASDGLFDNLYLEEIIELIRKGPLQKVATQLAEKCTARMQAPKSDQPRHADDLSFILFRLG